MEELEVGFPRFILAMEIIHMVRLILAGAEEMQYNIDALVQSAVGVGVGVGEAVAIVDTSTGKIYGVRYGGAATGMSQALRGQDTCRYQDTGARGGTS